MNVLDDAGSELARTAMLAFLESNQYEPTEWTIVEIAGDQAMAKQGGCSRPFPIAWLPGARVGDVIDPEIVGGQIISVKGRP